MLILNVEIFLCINDYNQISNHDMGCQCFLSYFRLSQTEHELEVIYIIYQCYQVQQGRQLQLKI